MNWPMIVISLYAVGMSFLIWKAAFIDTQANIRIKLRKHFQELRDANVPPEDYHLFNYLIEHHLDKMEK